MANVISKFLRIANRLVNVICGRHIRVVSTADPAVLGVTDGNEIQIGFMHPLFNGRNETQRAAICTGVAFHEALHNVWSDFSIIKHITNDSTISEFKRKVLLELNNIMEDAAIEYFGRQDFPGDPSRCLNFVCHLIFNDGPKVNKQKGNLAQLMCAFIQYGDVGRYKGKFTDKKAKKAFVECVPYLDRCTIEPSPAKRFRLVKKVYDIIEPLIKDEEEMFNKNQEMFKKLIESIAKLLRKGHMQENSSKRPDRRPHNSGDPGDDKQMQARRIFVARLRKDMGEGEGEEPGEGDIIIEDFDDGDDSSESQNGDNGDKSEPKNEKNNEGSSGSSNSESGEEKDKSKSSGKSGSKSSGKSGDDEEEGEDGEGAGSDGADSSDGEKDNNKNNMGKKNNGNDSDDDEGEGSADDADGEDDEENGSKQSPDKLVDSKSRTGGSRPDGDEDDVARDRDDDGAGLVDEENDEFKELFGRLGEELDRLDSEELQTKRLEEKNEAKLAREMNPDFTLDSSIHRNVRNHVVHVRCSSPEAEQLYNELLKPIRTPARIMSTRLAELLKNPNDKRRTKSGTLDIMRALTKPTSVDVFSKHRNLANEADLAVLLLIDESGSMHQGNRYAYARQAAILVYEVCSAIGVPLAVIGFTTSSTGVHHRHFVRFGSKSKAEKTGLVEISYHNSNRDGYSIRYAASILAQRPESKRLMLVVSDGAPADMGYAGPSAILDTHQAVLETQRKGIEVIGIGLNVDLRVETDLKSIYPHYVGAQKVSELPVSLVKLIKKRVIER